jgi:hypothetical protein
MEFEIDFQLASLRWHYPNQVSGIISAIKWHPVLLCRQIYAKFLGGWAWCFIFCPPFDVCSVVLRVAGNSKIGETPLSFSTFAFLCKTLKKSQLKK